MLSGEIALKNNHYYYYYYSVKYLNRCYLQLHGTLANGLRRNVDHGFHEVCCNLDLKGKKSITNIFSY